MKRETLLFKEVMIVKNGAPDFFNDRHNRLGFSGLANIMNWNASRIDATSTRRHGNLERDGMEIRCLLWGLLVASHTLPPYVAPTSGASPSGPFANSATDLGGCRCRPRAQRANAYRFFQLCLLSTPIRQTIRSLNASKHINTVWW